ncbi:MAG: hypothetical protein COW27_01135 [Nitrosopumilales archaeon CG15_BIG_FIL_POST_REV_8_21_14_020_37_12]|nr:MAG: hypothetical protein COW27_01135 [Nitrosopumilales archaeon CG15_BIG_FIL_POST_REV_8_21_14_020_37_12]
MKYFVIFLLAIGAFVILQNPAYATCVYDPSNPHVTCDDSIGTLDYPTTPEELIPSPLKQMSLGIKLGHVICDDAHVLTYKTDYKPACVFPDSEGTLLTRGWAKLRLLLPAGPDPIKELELTGQNELSYRITGNVIYGDDVYPLSNDRIREIVTEYSQKHHPDKQYLEYSIPIVQPFISVEDKVEFDLLEWGNYSDCWKLKLRIIDVQNKPVYEDSLANYCLEPDDMSGTFHSYSMGKDFEEFTCPHPGYYRIEVSNGSVFSPQVLQNFVCLEYKPEPAPEPEMTSESQPTNAGLEVDVTGQKQVRRGTTHDITIDVTRNGNPVHDALVRITIEDYGKDVIREFNAKTDSSGRVVFSWEIPKSFDDIETLLAYVDVTDNISAKTALFKFQVYCLPNESGCKVEGN